MHLMRKILVTCMAFVLVMQAGIAEDSTTKNGSAPAMVSAVRTFTKVPNGLIAFPAGIDEDTLVSLAQSPGPLVYAQVSDKLAAIRDRLGQKGLNGRRIWLESGSAEHIALASDIADMVAVPLTTPKTAAGEVARVVAPGGVLAVWGKPGQDELLSEWCRVSGLGETRLSDAAGFRWALAVKPFTKGCDDWPVWYHGPDNNPVSSDTTFNVPDIWQYIENPIHGAHVCITVISGGRVFTARGASAGGARGLDTLLTLSAHSAFNGQELWRRSLPEGTYPHRSLYFATTDVFYHAEKGDVLLLDTRTGKELSRWNITSNGEIKWIGSDGQRLFILAGPADPPANRLYDFGVQDVPWVRRDVGIWKHGYGLEITAIKLSDGAKIWQWKPGGNIDSRSPAISDGRLFTHVWDTGVFALNSSTGKELWLNRDSDIKTKLADLRPGEKVSSSASLIATPEYVFLAPTACRWLLCFDSLNGRLLWTIDRFAGSSADYGGYHLNMIFLENKLYAQTAVERQHQYQNTEIDPQTGSYQLGKLPLFVGGCMRPNAAPGWIFGRGKFANYRKRAVFNTPMRSDCYSGVIVAYGRSYYTPFVCQCNYPLGTVARTVRDYEKRLEAESAMPRLNTGFSGSVVPLVCDERDWSTESANNSRSGYLPVILSGRPSIQWTFQPKSPSRATAAVAVGKLVFVGNDDGSLRCLDLSSGNLLWTSWTGSRIHTPPTVWSGRILVGSGDGYVYAFAADNGRILWRFRVAPMERRIMFYGALASTWPVLGGVMVHDGIAYASAGTFGNDGVWVCALDAATGKSSWLRESGRIITGSRDLEVSATGGWTVANGLPRLASGEAFSPATFNPKDGQFLPLTGQLDGTAPSNRYVRGARIGTFHGRHILYGGRFMFNAPWFGGYYGRYEIISLDSNGDRQAADSALADQTTAWPVWNDSVFVTAEYKTPSKTLFTPQVLECFDAAKLDAYLVSRVMTPSEFKQHILAGGESGLKHVDPNLRGAGMVKWKTEHPSILAMALASNAVVIVEEQVEKRTERPTGWTLKYIDIVDGTVRSAVPLPGCVTPEGLALGRDGTVLVSLLDGRVIAER